MPIKENNIDLGIQIISFINFLLNRTIGIISSVVNNNLYNAIERGGADPYNSNSFMNIAAKDADIADIKSPIIGLLIMFYYIVINDYLFSISDIFNFIIIPLFFMNGILVCSKYWQDKYYNNNSKRQNCKL